MVADIFDACERGDVALVTTLIKTGVPRVRRAFTHPAACLIARCCIPQDVRSIEGRTPLMVAALNGHTDVARLLIAAGSGTRRVAHGAASKRLSQPFTLRHVR